MEVKTSQDGEGMEGWEGLVSHPDATSYTFQLPGYTVTPTKGLGAGLKAPPLAYDPFTLPF